MKKIYKQFFISALSLTALLFISCDKADYTEDATIEVAQNVKGTTTLDSPLQATQTVSEENTGKYQFTINITEEQPVDIHVKVKVKSGTATAGEDFTFDETVVIKAYTKSGKGNIAILNDDFYEPTENFTLQIGGDVATSNATVQATTISFNILNYLSDNLDLKFNFDKAFVDQSELGPNEPKTLCGIGYDLDFYVLDKDLNDTGNYEAAAAGCPEVLTVSPDKFPNGTYHIYYDVYQTHGLNDMVTPEFDIPISVDYNRVGGLITGTFDQEPEFAATSKTADGTKFDYVITIVVKDGVYTLQNSVPETIATGKSINKVLTAIKQARLNNKK